MPSSGIALFLALRRWILESDWFWIPGLPFPSCIILSKSLNVSEPLRHRIVLRNLAFSPSINSSFLLVLVIQGPWPSDLSIFSQCYICFPLSHLLGLVACSYVFSQPSLTHADPWPPKPSSLPHSSKSPCPNFTVISSMNSGHPELSQRCWCHAASGGQSFDFWEIIVHKCVCLLSLPPRDYQCFVASPTPGQELDTQWALAERTGQGEHVKAARDGSFHKHQVPSRLLELGQMLRTLPWARPTAPRKVSPGGETEM